MMASLTTLATTGIYCGLTGGIRAQAIFTGKTSAYESQVTLLIGKGISQADARAVVYPYKDLPTYLKVAGFAAETFIEVALTLSVGMILDYCLPEGRVADAAKVLALVILSEATFQNFRNRLYLPNINKIPPYLNFFLPSGPRE